MIAENSTVTVSVTVTTVTTILTSTSSRTIPPDQSGLVIMGVAAVCMVVAGIMAWYLRE